MADLKVFRVAGGRATEVRGERMPLERHLQSLIETNMEEMLGVRFLASEFPTGDAHGGRIDTLGLDEAGSPVIVEYKRARDQNVMNQALFYLAWLLDHRGDFNLLVTEKLGPAVASSIDWTSPRMICVAGDFTRYDAHAVRCLGQAMDLVRYRLYRSYGDELFTLDLVESSVGRPRPGKPRSRKHLSPVTDASGTADEQAVTHLTGASPEMCRLFGALDAALLDLGEVHRESLKTCLVYRALRGFAWVRVQKEALVVTLRVNPETVELVDGFTRDLRGLGHNGGGDLEVRIRSHSDISSAVVLFQQSFEAA
ncbi:DUF5655 domain-containing protein [Streptomyces phyllanthi]|uniref:DUF5655 domain-containing protein n=2 Tax=Streptomyces phyllanthi TaxID=1803180 RepID=A0A5N8W0T9_9ACTN|nr:hypothetical protein [Streptomyces phyllanthi]